MQNPDAPTHVAAIMGDGAGPELIDAARTVLDATGASLEVSEIDPRGADWAQTLDSLRHADAVLKGPLATPSDGSRPSINIALKRDLGLHTQIRRIRALGGVGPDGMDVHVIRQATEGLLTGLGTGPGDVSQTIAEITGHDELADAAISFAYASASATRRTFEIACDVAEARGCTEIVAAQKAAAVRHRDAFFADVGATAVADRAQRTGSALTLRLVAVDSVAARLVSHPRDHQIIVAPNLYGDVLSDVAGAVAGSVALIAGVNVGDDVAVFEAAHGVVSRHAGRGTANPIGLILAGAQLLAHTGHVECSRAVEEGVTATLRAGIGPSDLHLTTTVNTAAFAAEVVRRLS